MYGIFFEEINHDGGGGMYAELVRNRYFEETELPSGYYVGNGNLHSTKGLKNHVTRKSSNFSSRWSKAGFPDWILEKKGVDDAIGLFDLNSLTILCIKEYNKR
jgi:alpha-N-arabinofuranosidase